MALNRVTPTFLGRSATTIPAMTAGQWYQVAYFRHNVPIDNAGATVEVSDGTGTRSTYIRIDLAAAQWRHDAILLQEYSALHSGTYGALSRARIVYADNAAQGWAARFDVYSQSTTPQPLQMRLTHKHWTNGTRWHAIATPSIVPAVPSTGGSVWIQRGLGPIGQWITPTLQNGWVNYGDVYAPVRYRMNPGSQVEVQGLVQSGVQAHFTPIFTFAEGFRPSQRHIYVGLGGNNDVSRIDLDEDGQISNPTGVNSFLALNGVRFLAEN